MFLHYLSFSKCPETSVDFFFSFPWFHHHFEPSKSASWQCPLPLQQETYRIYLLLFFISNSAPKHKISLTFLLLLQLLSVMNTNIWGKPFTKCKSRGQEERSMFTAASPGPGETQEWWEYKWQKHAAFEKEVTNKKALFTWRLLTKSTVTFNVKPYLESLKLKENCFDRRMQFPAEGKEKSIWSQAFIQVIPERDKSWSSFVLLSKE